jgi:hypoxanthine phosphoribosyltransferase
MIAPIEFPCLVSKQELEKMIERVADKIDRSYPEGEDLVCIGVLKGAWIFHSDLVRALKRPVSVDFIRASSYGNAMESSGVVRIDKDIEVPIRGRHVLLVEDIVDTGRTLNFLKKRMENGGAKSVKIAALLDKKSRRVVECEADFVGTEIEDKFVVGYGLDWAEKYRTLPGIYYVPPEIAEKAK